MAITKRIARVFPRRTKYTPDDNLVYISPPGLFDGDFDSVLVSCLFTWDKTRAERLAEKWSKVCSDTKLGGPAYDDPGGEFTPEKFNRKGFIHTSRGCIRKCSFCFVPKREGALRELTIHEGPWIMDNNLLACSEKHVTSVFDMLDTQRDVKFLGGLDARILKDYQIDRLVKLGTRLKYFYFAYDNLRDQEAVSSAIDRCYKAGLEQKHMGCYVLVGYEEDTPEQADKRCEWVFVQGGQPFAMFYRDDKNKGKRKSAEWQKVVKKWTWQSEIFRHIKADGLKYHKKLIRGKLAESTK